MTPQEFIAKWGHGGPAALLDNFHAGSDVEEMGSDHDFAQQNSCSDPISSAHISQASTEATWPRANVVIGNPPFLGGSKKRRELGDAYFAALDTVFAGCVPGGADLVCYWFDKARVQIQVGQLQSAGLTPVDTAHQQTETLPDGSIIPGNMPLAPVQQAHEAIKTVAIKIAVAAAYGWPDYRADMSDDEILKRLLALNLARSATISPMTKTPKS